MAEVGVLDIISVTIQPGTKTAGEYKSLMPGQTVCTSKDAKGQNCTGHVKQWFTAPPDVKAKAAPGNTLHRCQRCYIVYEGPIQQFLYPIKK